jgi:alkylation response protein AidB-like acyl-CoA dehydrogenase
MQFILTDLQKEIKENAEKLLSEKIDLLETIKKVDEDNRLDSELWKLVNEQGWLALDVPEEDGGLGFSSVDSSILSEVAGYYLPIIPLFSSGVVFKHLLLNSNEEIKKSYLPGIISGEKIGTFGVYESDKYEISDKSIQTSITSSKDGLVLNGSKKYVMFGDTSDYIAVLAKDGSDFKFVLINTSDDGVAVTKTPSLDQTRPLAEISFTDVLLDPQKTMIVMDHQLSVWKKGAEYSYDISFNGTGWRFTGVFRNVNELCQGKNPIWKTYWFLSSNSAHVRKYVDANRKCKIFSLQFCKS